MESENVSKVLDEIKDLGDILASAQAKIEDERESREVEGEVTTGLIDLYGKMKPLVDSDGVSASEIGALETTAKTMKIAERKLFAMNTNNSPMAKGFEDTLTLMKDTASDAKRREYFQGQLDIEGMRGELRRFTQNSTDPDAVGLSINQKALISGELIEEFVRLKSKGILESNATDEVKRANLAEMKDQVNGLYQGFTIGAGGGLHENNGEQRTLDIKVPGSYLSSMLAISRGVMEIQEKEDRREDEIYNDVPHWST